MTCEPPAADTAIILFDGVCNLCNAAVSFVLARDSAGRFAFAALQSAAGLRLQRQYGLTGAAPDSVVLIDRGRVYMRSDAALRIARGLGWPWALLGMLLLLPVPLRDPFYAFVARYRYRWFGRRGVCRLPSPEERGRFLS